MFGPRTYSPGFAAVDVSAGLSPGSPLDRSVSASEHRQQHRQGLESTKIASASLGRRLERPSLATTGFECRGSDQGQSRIESAITGFCSFHRLFSGLTF